MPRTYVDNAYNRSVGRVGMEHGSFVVSRSSSGGGGGYGGLSYGGGWGSSSGYSSGSGRTYVDNSMNRSLGRVGMALGTAVHSSSGGGGSRNSTTSSSDRTYVDNASNRRLGRVGMALGTAVQSSSSSGTKTGSGTKNSSTSSSTKSYVDNSLNRSLGRVGMTLGTAVHSSSSGGTSSSPKTYVDNAPNRALGRVGLPHGTAVHSSSSTSAQKVSSPASVPKRSYVDNAYNRRLGRVGLPFGSMVVSKSSTTRVNQPRCYVDNPLNRRLGRVGKIVGTAPVSSQRRVVQDSNSVVGFANPIFQSLVGIDPEEDDLSHLIAQIQGCREIPQGMASQQTRDQFVETAVGIVKRHEASVAAYTKGIPTTPYNVGFGEIINFNDIELGDRIGGGGFGDVHVAIWRGVQVAVKKLRVQRVSKERKEQFEREVKVFSALNHSCIVRFLGACVVTPNLAIVMEFLDDGSLWDVLHVEKRRLSHDVKDQMVQDMLEGLKYLHEREIAHRDVKSMNVMVYDGFARCKLGDFGLALKDESYASSSVAEHSAVGTLKYSPPEVVMGKRLKVNQLKLADIYSLTLVVAELLTGREPYQGMNQHQVRAAILQSASTIPGFSTTATSKLSDAVKGWVKKGLSKGPKERPSAAKMLLSWDEMFLSKKLGDLSMTEADSGGSQASSGSHSGSSVSYTST